MAAIRTPKKNLSVNPVKSSAPMGAALAYLGIDGAVPLFHGSQGCTSFALTLAVRHFKEDMPLQTTAIDEVATVLGGADNLEEALINLTTRMKPQFVGIATTALVETRGEDFVGDLRNILARRDELAETKIVLASTPDFSGALEDGWAAAVTAIIEGLVIPGERRDVPLRQINVLPGVHLTSGDIEELRDLIAAFGFTAAVLPDVSGSLDGHVNEQYSGPTSGGTKVGDIAEMGRALHTIAIGHHMRPPAEALQGLTGVPTTLFASLTGLAPVDSLVTLLSHLSGQPVPASVKRRRSQLVDMMLDGHFHFGDRRIAIAADPDLLRSLSLFFGGLGAAVVVAVASTGNSPALGDIPADEVIIGDLGDFEAAAAARGAELLVTHAHGRQAAERLGVPLLRVGFPIFDRLGAQHRCRILYRGTRDLIADIANLFIAVRPEKGPADFADVLAPMPAPPLEDMRHAPIATC
ncbi:nitrogenase iron-molybdenum cofactor biosynthesis protein NifN [Oleomonas cavernae]|uniref:Nitrogenase iron-molybdenum cofactor biosynthesis protein NifN n=1 Tax=Oleomonas cavernae TaxID=2320859 RepID=A0A418W962_9PROT|nr:nitrogenase iron-molybdenum cofactor biosynthesis protein NifN [Oleomonas cavernae]RJF86526.1 nitrogenase iron-molybdenum cofactor biosynthesis protein NifN [Oleomonas cavernae]